LYNFITITNYCYCCLESLQFIVYSNSCFASWIIKCLVLTHLMSVWM